MEFKLLGRTRSQLVLRRNGDINELAFVQTIDGQTYETTAIINSRKQKSSCDQLELTLV